MSRVIVWFSAGAASAVAWRLAVTDYGDSVIAAYTDPGSEHTDNQRFIADCEKWIGSDVIRLKSKKYSDTWEVFEKRRFLNSPRGALCTTELKKIVRRDFQQPDDLQVFGYTAEEQHRADRFREQNPEVNLVTPLIDRGLTKDDCLAMIDRAGIELPAMYKLGYRNNNCIGCVKGGMGYWNKIRDDFPATFARMAAVERDIGATILRDNNEPLYLDELQTGRGDYPGEPDIQCGLLCMAAEDELK